MSARARRAALLGALAALAVGACHGPPVGEADPDGGAGAGGRGGATGSAGTGAGDAGHGGAAGSASGVAGSGTGTAGRGGAAGATGGSGATGAGGTTGASGASGGAGAGGRGGTTGAGGASGGAGNGGRGGSTGTGGGACAPQFQPTMFYTGDYGPVISDGTSTRYYWVEQSTPWVSVHYASTPNPTEITHPYQFDASVASFGFDVAFGEGLLAGLTLPNGEPHLEAWGPSVGAAKLSDVLDSLDRMEVTVDGSEAYVSRDDPAFAGIYRWNGQGEDTEWVSYAAAGLTANQIIFFRATPKYFVIADQRDAWVLDRSTKQLALVFQATANIIDVITSRPHTTTAGVLFRTQDGLFPATGHDYYLDLTAATLGTPRDLPLAILGLAANGACPQFSVKEGGVLYGNRYIYESTSGLVAVTLSSDGTPGQSTRLTNIELRYPEVTGGGDLYASWQPNFKWNYYYVGGL